MHTSQSPQANVQPLAELDPRLDLSRIRLHARQLQDDLEAIKAELAQMKSKFQVAQPPSSAIEKQPSA